jgi:phosphoserine / homoserine phosphotransferase
MYVICSDLEGVFVPEIWINVSKQTGIEELKLTTRDIDDYNVLMKGRLDILKKHNITLPDIRNVISRLKPLRGAREFIRWVRSRSQFIVVSDTFIEFAGPLLEQMGQPTLFCHHLTVDNEGNITGYNLRQKDAKKMVVEALQNLNYKVIAIGDSYNDISMLRKAELGILFNPPQSVIDENKDLQVVYSYAELKMLISQAFENENQPLLKMTQAIS